MILIKILMRYITQKISIKYKRKEEKDKKKKS